MKASMPTNCIRMPSEKLQKVEMQSLKNKNFHESKVVEQDRFIQSLNLAPLTTGATKQIKYYYNVEIILQI